MIFLPNGKQPECIVQYSWHLQEEIVNINITSWQSKVRPELPH